MRLVPLSDVAGLGAQGPIYAVRLEPDGQQFSDLMRITIVPTEEIAREEQVMFRAGHDGGAPSLALIDLEAEATVVLVQHFSIVGYVGVADSQLDHAFGVERAELIERLTAEISAAVLDARRESSGSNDRITAAYDEFDRQVVEPTLREMPNNCSSAQAVISTFVSVHKSAEIIGAERSQIDLVRLEQAAADACEPYYIRRCKQKRDPAILTG